MLGVSSSLALRALSWASLMIALAMDRSGGNTWLTMTPCPTLPSEWMKPDEALFDSVTAWAREPAARFAKLNTDEAQGIAGRYGIRSIPTLIVFKGGREVARQPGAMASAQLMRWVSDALR